MRIIAGEFKGRRLAAVRGHIRPTSDKVREAIFNILGPAVVEARVLDLFAGTGALSLEALSRGANHAVLVEEHGSALGVLRQNIENLGLQDRVTVMALPVAGALRRLSSQEDRFSLIFLDPPYGRGLAPKTLAALAACGLCRPEARVVVEHSHRESLPERLNRLGLQQSKRYGDTSLTIYGVQENSQEQELSG
jgi:16S rRNA (guanine(966)-N(2))-methyltransferase RsmD